MKSDFHFHFYSRIFIMLILAVSLFFIQKSVKTTAAITYPYEVTGWSWNNKVHWLSLNCYNDFDVPGEYISTCAASNDNYALKIAEGGNISGCMWAGNNVGGGGSALGWVCFNDRFGGLRQPAGNLYQVATSSQYLNAVASTTFASIISFEDWRCVGGANNGLRCAPNTNFCSATGGICTFTDDEKWKLGFPMKSPLVNTEDDFPSVTNPLQGCFNCYEEYTYVCSSTGDPCDPAGAACLPSGTPPTPQECVVYSTEAKCDNCLEYFYYPGRCEAADGTPSLTMGCNDFVASTVDCCVNNDDCSIGETCQPVSSCIHHMEYPTHGHYEEYNCTPRADGSIPNQAVCNIIATSPNGSPCQPRALGSYRKTIGGYDCSTCTIEDFDNRCYLNAEEANLNRCEACADLFYYPGVMIDNKHYNLGAGERAYMCGWAWNAWDDNGDGSPDNGLYWFQFSPRVVTSTRPFLSVESGNIYSQKGVSGDYLPPFGHYNSSYLIESGGSISNFISSSTLSGLYQGEIPYQPIISFLKPNAGKYSNALGNIDYSGLITPANPPLNNINKYGSTIITTGDTTYFTDDTLLSESKVYYYNSNVEINTPGAVANHTIIAGTGTQNAARTVVVNGNLTIGDNFGYGTAVYTNFRNIPSIVWIVKGDLFIDADVSQLVGTFIVLGNDGIDSCAIVAPATEPPAGCGQVVTCEDRDIGSAATCGSFPLIINGSVMAKYFDLNRTYVLSSDPHPSEQFINDGRLHINPPAGFDDLSKVIPRFSEN